MLKLYTFTKQFYGFRQPFPRKIAFMKRCCTCICIEFFGEDLPARIFTSILYKLKCKWGLFHPEWTRGLQLRCDWRKCYSAFNRRLSWILHFRWSRESLWILRSGSLFKVIVNPGWRALNIWGGCDHLCITRPWMTQQGGIPGPEQTIAAPIENIGVLSQSHKKIVSQSPCCECIQCRQDWYFLLVKWDKTCQMTRYDTMSHVGE